LRRMADAIEGLKVDPKRMRDNLDATRGLIMAEAVTMALGERVGRLEAHHLVEKASRRAVEQGIELREALAGEPEVQAYLSAEQLSQLFPPESYLGIAERFVARVLAGRKARK